MAIFFLTDVNMVNLYKLSGKKDIPNDKVIRIKFNTNRGSFAKNVIF